MKIIDQINSSVCSALDQLSALYQMLSLKALTQPEEVGHQI